MRLRVRRRRQFHKIRQTQSDLAAEARTSHSLQAFGFVLLCMSRAREPGSRGGARKGQAKTHLRCVLRFLRSPQMPTCLDHRSPPPKQGTMNGPGDGWGEKDDAEWSESARW